MRIVDFIAWTAIFGMWMMLLIEATSVSTNPDFLIWYYLKGGKAQVTAEIYEEFTRTPLYNSSLKPESNLLNVPRDRLLPAGVDYSDLIKKRAISRYNEISHEGEGKITWLLKKIRSCLSSLIDKLTAKLTLILATMALIRFSRFWEKLRGLTGITNFEGEALFYNPRPSPVVIHTLGMRFPVDIEVYGERGELIEKIENMKPWRVKFVFKRVEKVIERPSKSKERR